MKYLYCCIFLFLTACSSVPSKPIEVQVPISIPCNIDKPVKPDFLFTKLNLNSNIFDQVKILLAERKQRQGYELELEAAIDACNK